MKRESNIELLRIIAMFMVLGLHATFSAIGPVEPQEINKYPLQSFIQLTSENIYILGVNVFVLISGWFGIKFKTKGLSNYIFQCLFFSCIVYIPFFIIGEIDINKINIISIFLLYNNAYWFVWAYLVLYIFSPVLNSFLENSDKKNIKKIIILLFIAQTIITIFTRVGFYKVGFSPLSFINLYLLARYFKLYMILNGKYRYFLIFFVSVFSNTLIYYLPTYFHLNADSIYSISKAYINPFNIIGALSIVIFFSKLKINSRVVNWFAASSFAVYLLHMHCCIEPYYLEYAKDIFNKFSGMVYLCVIACFMITVFVISVLIDKVRLACFNFIWNRYEKRFIKHQ